MNMHSAVKYLGGTALLRVESVRVPVHLADVKPGYGSFRFLVRPVGGRGEQWVDEGRLTFEQKGTEQ